MTPENSLANVQEPVAAEQPIEAVSEGSISEPTITEATIATPVEGEYLTEETAVVNDVGELTTDGATS